MSPNRADNPTTSSTGRPALPVLRLVGSLLLVSGVVWGCAGQAAAMAEATSQPTRAAGSDGAAAEAAAAIDAFGFDFYRAALASDGNAVFSPASVVLALSMAQAGALGETASQMDSVLHSAAGAGGGNGINSLDQILTGASGTFKDQSNSDRQVTLRIANAPFAQRDMQLQQPFLDTLASRYGAGLRLVDFKGDPNGTCSLMNSWVSDQTEGRIPKLLDSLDSQTRLVLVNAIYLKAPWMAPFNEANTKTAPFTRADGSQVSVPTMALNLTEGSYASGTGWRAVELPYVNPSLAMTIIVPDDLAAFESSLDGTRFAEITAALQGANVDLTLPRFKIETKSDLAARLADMGMPLAFDPTKADFSGITTQEQLYIAKVIHQANISVDEKGTEASAATAVVMLAGAMPGRPIAMKVDRPFIFALRDTNTGAILFLGRVVDPSA
jgi:serpin B